MHATVPFKANGEIIGTADVVDGMIQSVDFLDTPLAREISNALGTITHEVSLSLIDWESEIDKWRRAWLKELPSTELDQKKVRWPKKTY